MFIPYIVDLEISHIVNSVLAILWLWWWSGRCDCNENGNYFVEMWPMCVGVRRHQIMIPLEQTEFHNDGTPHVLMWFNSLFYISASTSVIGSYTWYYLLVFAALSDCEDLPDFESPVSSPGLDLWELRRKTASRTPRMSATQISAGSWGIRENSLQSSWWKDQTEQSWQVQDAISSLVWRNKHNKESVEGETEKLGPVVLTSKEYDSVCLFCISSYRKPNNHALITEKGQHQVSSILIPPQIKVVYK